MGTTKLRKDHIFNNAADIQDSVERAAYLDEACGTDISLRQDVEELLRHDQEGASFLQSPPGGIEATQDMPLITELPGTQIGPYKLLEQIGEGGMGVVYMASQREPIRRTVALKIIKPGMDTREVVARFEAERQALAMMDHPNIAKVFDAGATDAGRPYFAMELVKGTPITEYCDRQQLSTRERLELFVTLCHGVQHAHQKGVIHRDLKPSNLLIEVHDVRPVPKIIDFGIAKALGQQLTEKTFHTGFEQMVGTPLYMSPEQAGQSCMDVDTRSDIYSVGVLLYELLTGQTPFEKGTLRTAGVDEMRRIIREVEPPRPSARVSTLQAADLSTVCDRRNVEPHKLSQELRGELDWIVMKAMDKDRDRRYATVNDLAADVERYLHDEPVQACPPSVAYRFTKFARRNRAALVTSALVALALMVGSGVSIWQAMVATRAKQQTAQALLKAEERLQFGRQAVDDMYTQFAEKWLAQQAELTQVQKQFLEKALAFYQRLATEESDDPTVRFETAKAQQRAGSIQCKLGQHTEAEASLRQARDLLQQLVREQPAEPQYRDCLAQTQRILGNLLSFTGRLSAAEQELRSAVKICQVLAAEFPGEAEYQVNLADRYYNLGRLLGDTGRAREAEAAYRQSITVLESLLANSPDDPGQRSILAVLQDKLAGLIGADKPAEAETLHRAAIQANTSLLTADPKNTEYRSSLAANHNNLGMLLQQLGRPLEAETSYRAAVSMYEELVAELPDIPFHRLQIAKNLHNLAQILEAAGKSDEADQLALQSQEVLEKLASDYPEIPEYQARVFDNRMFRANHLIQAGKWDEARTFLEQAIEHQKAALEINPKQACYQVQLSAHLTNLLLAQLTLRDHVAAARTAENFAHRIIRLDSTLPVNATLICEFLIEMAEMTTRPDFDPQRRESDLAASFLLCKAVIKDAVQQAPNDPDQYHIADLLSTAPEPLRDPGLALRLARRAVELKPGNGQCLQSLGWALYRTGDLPGAIEALQKTSDGGEKDFVRAMIHWQLREKTEARASFDGVSEQLKGHEPRYEENLKRGILTYPLPVQLKRLQAEAAALLGVTLPTVEPAPEPAAKAEEARELPKTTPAPEAAKGEEESQ